MNNCLAILIPTIEGREWYLDRLMQILSPQLSKHRKEAFVLFNKDDRRKTIGQKRNDLTAEAIECGATHRAFIDDDDLVTPNYLELNMPGVLGNYDCNSLVGIYSLNGFINPNKHLFYHSLKYDHWWEDGAGYYRNPNHLNVVSLLKCGHIKFPESNFGEDGQWSERVIDADCLKKEYEINEPFYYYLDRTKVNGV